MDLAECSKSDEQQLDEEYRKQLQILRNLVPSLQEPRDVKQTALWLERFQQVPSREKVLRNRCVSLLIQQLKEDNLTVPFIFLRYLTEPLETLLEIYPELGGDVPEPPSIPFTEHTAAYTIRLLNAVKAVLKFKVQTIIENHERDIEIPPEYLHTEDRRWLTDVLEGIRTKVKTQFEIQAKPTTRSIHSQTVNESDQWPNDTWKSSSRDEIENYLERKFSKLYTNMRIREKARAIQSQSTGGVHFINLTQRLVRQLRNSTTKPYQEGTRE